MELVLNGLEVHLSDSTFTAYVDDMPVEGSLQNLRDELGHSWFFYREGALVYGLPKTNDPTPSFGNEVSLECKDHLPLLATRIGELVAEKYPGHIPLRRGFRFATENGDLVAEVCKQLGNTPSMMNGFKIQRRFDLESKVVEFQDGQPFLGLFVLLGTTWRIEVSIPDLLDAGIDLQGLYVVRRQPNPGQRNLLGRIASISGETVLLAESFDNTNLVDINDIWLEGSKTNFVHCLKTLLGKRYEAFDKKRNIIEAEILGGPALRRHVKGRGDFLRKQLPLQLAENLYCSIGEVIRITNSRDYSTVFNAPPVECCFDPARTKRSQVPWSGIERHGPFSRDTFARKSPTILVVVPDSVQGQLEQFLRSFCEGSNQRGYMGGFATRFGLINPRFVTLRVSWLGKGNGDPATAYRKSIESYLVRGDSEPDAAIVVILDEHSRLPDLQSPYLHSKAMFLMAGIPVQQVRAATLRMSTEQLQYTLRNIAIALYAKMGGTPWTVDQDLTISDELVIGMGSCEMSGSRFENKERYVGITTVFRGDGSYLLGNVSRECPYSEYPALLESETTAVLREIKARNGWKPGDTVRVIFHTYKPLKKIEVSSIAAQCVKEVGDEQNVEFSFLTVSQDHPFRILDIDQKGLSTAKGTKAVHVPERGTILQIGRYTRLLCANGPELIKRVETPLPEPILVNLHDESTYRDLTYLTQQVLKFTALSWRSTLPAPKPVTIYYSDLIAKFLSRMRMVPDWSPAMLNVKLRASRWFL